MDENEQGDSGTKSELHLFSISNSLVAMGMRICATASTVGVVALFAMPGTAIAKGGTFVIKPSRTTELQLKGSHGYSISVVGVGDGEVSLMAKHGGSSATYVTRGIASSTRLKARFGNFGLVSMRFHFEGAPRRVPVASKNCRGEGEIVERGHWIGRIEFAGEQEYTTVRASRAKGKVTRTLKETCRHTKGENDRPPDLKVTFLSATSETPAIFLTAFRITSSAYPALDGSAFGASLIERLGRRLAVIRTIDANAKADAFTSTKKEGQIESVTIEPPAPFKGSATFQRTTGSKGSWSGSLVGDFLGRGEVALAGPEFSAEAQG